MKRWHQRFKEINDGRRHDRSSDHYQDDVYAFFLNCFHLKDWIKHDETSSLKDDVKQFVNSMPCLEICRNICNCSKHLTLRPPNEGKEPKIEGRHVNLILGGSEQKLSIKYRYVVEGQAIDAFQLATECVQKWEEFIQKENVEKGA